MNTQDIIEQMRRGVISKCKERVDRGEKSVRDTSKTSYSLKRKWL